MTGAVRRIECDPPAYAYDAGLPPIATVPAGTRLRVATLDARGGALDDRPPGHAFDLPQVEGAANALTGPIAVEGAEPGDALIVEVHAIEVAATGWSAAAPDAGPLPPGRIDRAIGRAFALGGGATTLAAGGRLPLAPLLGCAGTAPPDPLISELAGDHGGNLDHPTLRPGARLHLPVSHPGGLLFLGDAHAVQGDGELSGWGLEASAEVELTIRVAAGMAPRWPWLETPGRVAVLAAAESFEAARAAAVGAVVDALEAQLGLAPAEALALLSLAGDLRLGQAYGAEVTTVRLELPDALGLRPHPRATTTAARLPCPT